MLKFSPNAAQSLLLSFWDDALPKDYLAPHALRPTPRRLRRKAPGTRRLEKMEARQRMIDKFREVETSGVAICYRNLNGKGML